METILFIVFLIVYGLWTNHVNRVKMRKLAQEQKRKYPSLYNRDGSPRRN